MNQDQAKNISDLLLTLSDNDLKELSKQIILEQNKRLKAYIHSEV